jgi:quercetin dioxygenase-like cupin family protein
MHPVLRLYEDVLSSAENVVFTLPPLPRFIFVVHGSATIDGKAVAAGEGWQGEGEVTVKPSAEGITCWRWELAGGSRGSTTANAPGMITHEKLTAFLETLPKGELIMRADSVGFPPGGCAYKHTHQGPGIRCLIEGGIRIDTHGRSTSYGPGGAWYEAGPDPVLAQAASDKPSRFIRVMILPRDLLGKSSIQYVNEDDRAKAKSQQYKIYADAPVSFAAKK